MTTPIRTQAIPTTLSSLSPSFKSERFFKDCDSLGIIHKRLRPGVWHLAYNTFTCIYAPWATQRQLTIVCAGVSTYVDVVTPSQVFELALGVYTVPELEERQKGKYHS